MRAVHVGVGHDHDLVVAQLVEIELVAANAGAQRRDQRADLVRAQHLVEPGALHIENLAAQGQHGLVLAVTALLGRAAGRIALDDEQFGLGRIFLLTIGELAGQGGDVQRALAPGQLARLARGFARSRRLDDLGDDGLGFARMLLEPFRQCVEHRTLDCGTDLAGDQLVLGLAGEFRIRHFHRQHAGQPFARIIAGDRHLGLGRRAGGGGILVDHPRQGAAETGQVRAAIALGDGVGEAQHGLVIAVIPLQGGFHVDALALAGDEHRLGKERRAVAVEMLHEGGHAAIILQHFFKRLGLALVAQHDAHAGIQEGQLAQAVMQAGPVEHDLGEGRLAGQEAHRRALAAIRVAGDAQILAVLRLAQPEAHEVLLAVAPDGQVQPVGQGVDH